MAEAYIVDAVRAPVGRRNGGLSQVHPADLGAHSIKALMERTGVDPGALDLASAGVAAQLPGELAHLGDGLGGDRLAEAGQAARRVDRDAAADGRGAAA